MFFTTVAFYGAWILFIFGCMGVLVPFAQKIAAAWSYKWTIPGGDTFIPLHGVGDDRY